VWSLLAVVELRAGHCRLAAEHLERALRLDPREPDALANRARLGQCKERP
jgi:cytochrome c-type biogenesis protein CcmH/NrfG